MTPFNYDGLFAANAPVTTRAANRHAQYDFAVAYPDPDTLPPWTAFAQPRRRLCYDTSPANP